VISQGLPTRYQGRVLNAFEISNDTASNTPPSSMTASATERTRKIASMVERPARNPY